MGHAASLASADELNMFPNQLGPARYLQALASADFLAPLQWNQWSPQAVLILFRDLVSGQADLKVSRPEWITRVTSAWQPLVKLPPSHAATRL